jgi:hypothetical protein
VVPELEEVSKDSSASADEIKVPSAVPIEETKPSSQ